MKGREVVFSSDSDEWETPQALFDELNKEFKFTLDAAASKTNRKCERYCSKENSGLKISWGSEVVWCNPPYSNWQEWVKKASEERGKLFTKSVFLLPARTDTKAFHDYIYKKPLVEVRFIRGRLKFSNSKNSAPFPSMIVVFE